MGVRAQIGAPLRDGSLTTGDIGDSCLTCIASHPSKSRIATGGSDFRVIEWDVVGAASSPSSSTGGAVLRTHRIPAHATSLEYSPDGTQLAVGLSNGLAVSLLLLPCPAPLATDIGLLPP